MPNNKRKKLDKRGVKCLFVGYARDARGYKLYDLTTGKFFISRDVIFDEESVVEVNENTRNGKTCQHQ